MDVYIIDRKGRKHIGFKGPEDKIYSFCNKRWYAYDKNNIGKLEDVTCKSCNKIIDRVKEREGEGSNV